MAKSGSGIGRRALAPCRLSPRSRRAGIWLGAPFPRGLLDGLVRRVVGDLLLDLAAAALDMGQRVFGAALALVVQLLQFLVAQVLDRGETDLGVLHRQTELGQH